MKPAHFFLLLFLFVSASCKEDNASDVPVNIEGKWNLDKYIDLEGVEHSTTYTIFGWYEQGFEFIGDKFYPRYDPERRFDTEVWETDYLADPGTYKLVDHRLILSYKDIQYEYGFDIIDENTIVISNLSDEKNPWTGSWRLVRHQ